MNKIYTKKGDGGKTRTFFGEISKSDELAEALGSIDELNSWIGLIRFKIYDLGFKNIGVELKRIQTNLLVAGSSIAGSKNKFKPGEIKHLEKLIDELTEQLSKLKNFIYPTGELQVARAVCRRAERKVAQLSGLPVYQSEIKTIIKYLNRLSDALFTFARWVNFKTGIKEDVWK